MLNHRIRCMRIQSRPASAFTTRVKFISLFASTVYQEVGKLSVQLYRCHLVSTMKSFCLIFHFPVFKNLY